MSNDSISGPRRSAWDIDEPSVHHSKSISEYPVFSWSPTNQNVLKSQQSFAPQRTPYIIEESSMPMLGPNPNQSAHLETPKKSSRKSCSDRITTTRVLGFLFGIVITAIPLAVILTLYFWPATTSTSGTSTTTTSPSANSSASSNYTLPVQCNASNYLVFNDVSRLLTSVGSCCSCDSGVSGWYRVTGLSGTRLATAPVSSGYCGALYPAWFNGSLPSTAGTTTIGTGCVIAGGDVCYAPYSVGPILATNCNGYYVFFLHTVICPCCSGYIRYCTT